MWIFGRKEYTLRIHSFLKKVLFKCNKNEKKVIGIFSFKNSNNLGENGAGGSWEILNVVISILIHRFYLFLCAF
jgi:hypothetical protein